MAAYLEGMCIYNDMRKMHYYIMWYSIFNGPEKLLLF